MKIRSTFPTPTSKNYVYFSSASATSRAIFAEARGGQAGEKKTQQPGHPEAEEEGKEPTAVVEPVGWREVPVEGDEQETWVEGEQETGPGVGG